MEREPGRLHLAELGRNAKPKAVARTGTYAVSWTSHDCAYSTPSTRSKPVRLNADGLIPISRTSSSVDGGGRYAAVRCLRPRFRRCRSAQRAGAVGVSATETARRASGGDQAAIGRLTILAPDPCLSNSPASNQQPAGEYQQGHRTQRLARECRNRRKGQRPRYGV